MEMIEKLDKLAPNQGFTLTRLDDVKLLRWNDSVPRSPVLYDPCIVIVCQGRKIGYLGEDVFHYNAKQFLVLSIPLPFESQTIASKEEPLLAISIKLNPSIVTELVLSLDEGNVSKESTQQAVFSTSMDANMSSAVLRLLDALTSPEETEIIGPSIVREIHYRALTSEQGPAVRAVLSQQNHVSKIGKALKLIHGEFASELNVNLLAETAGMSAAAFHANFKAVTSSSPMQYLKKTRLHKARLLMIQDNNTAASASIKVGYESSSQFSREYKRLFGRTPKEDVNLMKDSLVETPA